MKRDEKHLSLIIPDQIVVLITKADVYCNENFIGDYLKKFLI